MNDLIYTGRKIVWGRVARNIYFWVAVWWVKASEAKSAEQLALTTVLWAIFVSMFCLNNFLLVPRLLARGRTARYVGAATAMAVVTAIIYTLGLKLIMNQFPPLEPGNVSLIINYVSKDYSLASLAEDSLAYCFFFLFFTSLFTGAWYANDYVRQQVRMEEIKAKQAETELHFLKTQISPHFLFNTLNNIYGLAGKKSDLTQEVVLKLSDILRYLLYESNVPMVSFEKEKQIILSYIDLERLQLSDPGDMEFRIETDTPANIPPLLWLPVLENLFKHGARTLDGGEYLRFGMVMTKNHLEIYSESPCGTAIIDKPGGIGLANLRKRLALLYPGKHELSSGVSNDHFITKVKIDLS